MAWTKMKTAVVVGAGVLLAAGTATVAVKEIQKHEDENLQWQTRENLNSVWLQKAPPLLKIVPTKFPNGGGGVGVGNPSGWKAIRLGYTVKDMLADAYGFQDTRTAITTPLPQDKYDFIVTVPSNARQLLQNGIKKQFGLAGRFEFVETNVLLLSVKNPKADGLKASSGEMIYEGNNPGHFAGTNQPLGVLSEMLEGRFRIPVVDQTGLTNRYDFNLAWDEYGKKVGFRYPDYPNLDGLKQSLLDQLGLELVPTNMPIEMLVIEKAK